MDQGLCVQIGVAVDLEATGKLAVVAANENLSAPMNRPVFKQKTRWKPNLQRCQAFKGEVRGLPSSGRGAGR
jgi:hypothetical protein